MKWIFKGIIVIVFSLSASQVFAKRLGLGLIFGGPTGLSANYFLSKKRSVDLALAFSLGDEGRLYLHSTYLWRYPKNIRMDKVKFGSYWGAGARIISDDSKDDEEKVKLGLRVPGGFNYTFRKAPVEIFGELSLTMKLIPGTQADLDLALGVRYYF